MRAEIISVLDLSSTEENLDKLFKLLHSAIGHERSDLQNQLPDEEGFSFWSRRVGSHVFEISCENLFLALSTEFSVPLRSVVNFFMVP